MSLFLAVSDFIAVDATIIIAAGSGNEGSGCFQVTLEDNMAFENPESFLLSITDVEDNVEVHTPLLMFNINDNDGEGGGSGN